MLSEQTQSVLCAAVLPPGTSRAVDLETEISVPLAAGRARGVMSHRGAPLIHAEARDKVHFLSGAHFEPRREHRDGDSPERQRSSAAIAHVPGSRCEWSGSRPVTTTSCWQSGGGPRPSRGRPVALLYLGAQGRRVRPGAFQTPPSTPAVKGTDAGPPWGGGWSGVF